MKQIVFFSCTVQGLKKLAPIIQWFETNQEYQVKTIIVGWREREYCKENQISYHMIDEYSPLKRVGDWDTELATDALYRLLSKQKPDLLITIDGGGFMEAMFRFCRQQGIATVALQHGALIHRLQEVPLEADKYLYWGEYFTHQLSQLGVSKENIAITGSAQFDNTLKTLPQKEKISKQYQLDSQKKWYVFCGQTKENIPLEDSPVEVLKRVGEFLSKKTDVVLLYKPHPDQPKRELEDLQKAIPSLKILEDVDTIELIASAEGVMTYYSTVAIDAALLKKSVLLFNRKDLKNTVLPLHQLGAAICCDSLLDIDSKIQEFLDNTMTDAVHRTVIEQLNGNSTGQAIQNIVKECLAMLQ